MTDIGISWYLTTFSKALIAQFITSNRYLIYSYQSLVRRY